MFHVLTDRALPHPLAGLPPPVLMLDLAEVSVPTAAGLGELVSLHKRLRASGRWLVLCNVQEMAYEVFEVAGLAHFLVVRRD